MPVAIDILCSFGFTTVYMHKMPIGACDLLGDGVLPFYDARGVTIAALLTDNGREF